VLPKELKIFWGYTNYQFFTQEGISNYTAPANWQTFNPVAYADGFPIEWYIDPDTFYQDWPQKDNKDNVATATGLNSFTFGTTAYPILPGSLYVTDGTQIAQDDGTGGFVNPNNNNAVLAGSVNYSTGTVVGLAFASAPSVNATITASYQTYQANRPQGILFFPQTPLLDSTQASLDAVNMFVLRPVPDAVYHITMQGIKVPNPFLNYQDVPFRPDLGPLIALGAALHRFKLFNQMDQYAQYEPEYKRFKDICMQDTFEEMLYVRSIPKF